LETQHQLPLRSGDALHLALARRHRLTLVSADQTLGRCAQALGLPIQLIA
jgi:predicted nucleic acid-binding protein